MDHTELIKLLRAELQTAQDKAIDHFDESEYWLGVSRGIELSIHEVELFFKVSERPRR